MTRLLSPCSLCSYLHKFLRLSLPPSATVFQVLLTAGLMGLVCLMDCLLCHAQAETRPNPMPVQKRQAMQKSPPAFRPFALERNPANEAIYLRQGNARTLLSGWEEKAVSRAGGWKLILTPATNDKARSVRVLKGGSVVARLSLERLRDRLLENDAYWASDNTDHTGKIPNSHHAANQMRYMHRSAGGVGVFLSEAFPTAAGWVGVLNWQLYGPSGEPIGAQHLVFIPASPTPSIEPVRLLDASRGTTSAVQKRLFAYTERTDKTDKGAKLLLWEQRQVKGNTTSKLRAWGELTEVGSRGVRGRSFMRLPTYAHPYAPMGEQWLVCTNAESGAGYEGGGNRIDVVGLRNKTVRPVLVEPPTDRGYHPVSILGVDAATQTLLISRGSDSESADNGQPLFLLSVPSGKRRSLPKAWTEQVMFLWRGCLFLDSSQGRGSESGAAERTAQAYKVVDARTLKLVQQLPQLPPPR